MSKGNHKFKQSEVVRAIKAARAAGFDVRGFEVDVNGTIRVFDQNKDAPIKQTSSADLDRELAEFEARHGQN